MEKFINIWRSKRENSKYLNALDRALKKLNKTQIHRAQSTHEEVFQEMDCLACANCCKSIPPMLSGRDIKRIAKRLNLSKQDFAKKYTVIDEDGDTVINASPCPFLQENNACEIYEDRPAACRAYPHSGEQLFLKNISHHKRNMKYCPALMEIARRLTTIGKD